MYKNDDIEVPESVSYELSDTDKSNCEKAIAFMDANEFVESIRMGWYGSLEVEGDLSIDDVSLIVYRSGSIYIVITENYSGYDLEILV